jgi:hypothetical protein
MSLLVKRRHQTDVRRDPLFRISLRIVEGGTHPFKCHQPIAPFEKPIDETPIERTIGAEADPSQSCRFEIRRCCRDGVTSW